MSRLRGGLVLAALLFSACSGEAPPPAPQVRADEALRYCGMIAACGEDFRGLAECVRSVQLGLASGGPDPLYLGNPHDLARQVECAVSAADCAEMIECYRLGRPTGFCSGRPEDFCDGDVWVRCYGEDLRFVLDCAAHGLSCREGGGWFRVSCTRGVACERGTAPRCDGTMAVSCVDGLEDGLDCAVVWPGSVCALVSGTPTCVPDGAACSADRCDGSTFVRCFEGRELRVDCAAAAEGTCTDGADRPECVPTANECDPFNPPQFCDGDGIRVCVNGRDARLDCRAIGLRTCGIQTSGNPECVP